MGKSNWDLKTFLIAEIFKLWNLNFLFLKVSAEMREYPFGISVGIFIVKFLNNLRL